MVEAERGEVGEGNDDSGGGGGGGSGGWDMRVLLSVRTRTRCTKPHWEHHLYSLLEPLVQIGQGQQVVQCRTEGQEGGTKWGVAASEVYSLQCPCRLPCTYLDPQQPDRRPITSVAVTSTFCGERLDA